MIIIYFVVAFLATTIGALAGLGGGVIIKPVLDLIGEFDIATIGVISAFTVFSMAIVSIIMQSRYKVKIQMKKTIFIGLGSVVGGLVGEMILSYSIRSIDENLIVMIQNSILAILLALVLFYMKNKDKYRRYNVENLFKCLIIGLGLGMISSFLSIGGGPINICVLTIFFSMSIKETAINSIVTILFAQASKLITIFTTGGLSSYNLEVLPLMILGGILGGILGSRLNKTLSNKKIEQVFNVVVVGLIVLNIYNVIESF